MNIELQIALIRRYGSQAMASKDLGIETIPHREGIVKPNDRERAALERALGKALVKKILKPLPQPAPAPTDQLPAA